MTAIPQNDGDPIHVARAYQLEMFSDSTRRNIIVAMDTGSGKTQIAVLRIVHELERCPPEKIVWFMCPNIALAEQQHQVLSTQIPSVLCRLLTGNDGVDRWSNQSIWSHVLRGIRIVVCTHKVLFDALMHGFVKMSQIALLVFDEAHHCTKGHPANQIMKAFYHPEREAGNQDLPHVLGLTASPIITSKGGGLQTIEANMHSISRTPKIHREELLRHVHRPEMSILTYFSDTSSACYPSALRNLIGMYTNLNIEEDPYVEKLRSDGHDTSSAELRSIILSRKTYCQEQLKSLIHTARNIHFELGPWASQTYVNGCISKTVDGASNDAIDFGGMDKPEKKYLIRKLRGCWALLDAEPRPPDENNLSEKANRLVDLLVAEMNGNFTGIVFVQTRACVEILCRLLMQHPRTKDLLRIGTFVGTSNNFQHKAKISSLNDIKGQVDTIDDMRYGRKNLIISTSVCEEGIDISACNVVICFEPPANLKSFIQRRGRARAVSSKYIIMFDSSEGAVIQTWQRLEEDMKKLYMDDMRELNLLKKLEEAENHNRTFVVPSTGAKLVLQEAVSHLNHFCSTLPTVRWASPGPLFTFEEDEETNLVRATVTLPTSVDPSVRTVEGSRWWKSERIAKMDIAFDAYVALHKFGLVNDHLLPLTSEKKLPPDARAEVSKKPGLVSVSSVYEPLTAVTGAWHMNEPLYSMPLDLIYNDGEVVHLVLITPTIMPSLPEILLHLDASKAATVSFGEQRKVAIKEQLITQWNEITHLLLYSVYRSRMEADHTGFPFLFVPIEALTDPQAWLEQMSGDFAASELLSTTLSAERSGILRDNRRGGSRHIFQGLEQRPILDDPEGSGAMDWLLKVTRFPKRTDLLHPILPDRQATGQGFSYLNPVDCRMDRLSLRYSQATRIIPHVLHHLGLFLTTEHLCKNLLQSVTIASRDLMLFAVAITTSAAHWIDNYQRLEFFGDSILKLYTSLTLMVQHTNWHEGYLSHAKDRLVSNNRLAEAAQTTGLHRYIQTLQFTGQRWRPAYNDELRSVKEPIERQMSTKTLADVVEALLGACFLIGGSDAALACLTVFLPEMEWQPIDRQHEALYIVAQTHPVDTQLPSFRQLEQLIGHTFTCPALLIEAVTHPSHIGPDATPSYQRLEFLGDAVLDSIITRHTYHAAAVLAPGRMHLVRTALVNAHILAFFCLQHEAPLLHVPDVKFDAISGNHMATETVRETAIWHHMRHSRAPDLGAAQQRCLERFRRLRPAILAALRHGTRYPWAELVALDAEKFLSDLIEALLAAVYIDSHGDLTACEAVLDRLGLMAYLHRVLADGVHVWHPKEELGWLTGSQTVRYEVSAGNPSEIGGGMDDGLDDKGWTCRVWVGELALAFVEGARSKLEAETRAAEEAIRVWQRDKGVAQPSEHTGEVADAELKDVVTSTKSIELNEVPIDDKSSELDDDRVGAEWVELNYATDDAEEEDEDETEDEGDNDTSLL